MSCGMHKRSFINSLFNLAGDCRITSLFFDAPIWTKEGRRGLVLHGDQCLSAYHKHGGILF